MNVFRSWSALDQVASQYSISVRAATNNYFDNRLIYLINRINQQYCTQISPYDQALNKYNIS